VIFPGSERALAVLSRIVENAHNSPSMTPSIFPNVQWSPMDTMISKAIGPLLIEQRNGETSGQYREASNKFVGEEGTRREREGRSALC
jgi:hypothetical protein